LLCIILISVVFHVIREARVNYGVLEECGIPVVEPTLFLGSEPNLHNTVLHLADIEHRQDMELGGEMLNEIMEFQGEKWKQIRTFLSPLFTTSKIRQMSGVVAECAEEFVNDLKRECGTNGIGRVKIHCRERFTTCLIDMFVRTTFGIKIEDGKNPENKFSRSFREMLHEEHEYNWLFTSTLSFPFLQKLSPVYDQEPGKYIERTLENAIKSRIVSGSSSTKDFLDLLGDFWKRIEAGEFKQLGITQTTVVAQGVLFIVGGYETTSYVLSHLFWSMANHPEIQERMFLELQAALEKNPSHSIDHELINDTNIPFILACINETLRLYPSVYRPERICTKDWSYNGLSFKKGTPVMLASWAANRNPKYYPDEPEKFKPERFLPKNKGKLEPYAFTSFGFGPRSCIGMRFAYESMKLFVCNIVNNFKIELRADTELKYKPASPISIAINPLYLDFIPRRK
ncbi:Cytochrome P450 3A4, partial [Orchesella cincta]